MKCIENRFGFEAFFYKVYRKLYLRGIWSPFDLFDWSTAEIVSFLSVHHDVIIFQRWSKNSEIHEQYKVILLHPYRWEVVKVEVWRVVKFEWILKTLFFESEFRYVCLYTIWNNVVYKISCSHSTIDYVGDKSSIPTQKFRALRFGTLGSAYVRKRKTDRLLTVSKITPYLTQQEHE